MKIYENQTSSQTSKIFSKLIIKTPEQQFLKHSFVVNFEHVFVCWGIFRSSRGILKNNPIYTFRNFKGIYGEVSYSKRVVCSVYSKSPNTERNSSKYHTLQRQTLADVCKIDFTKFTRKPLYQILYLMKLQAAGLQLYCKKGPGADVFRWILWKF